jgi:ComF family protein
MEDEVAEAGSKFQFVNVPQFAKTCGRALVDVIVPPKCLSCRAPVTQGSSLCISCWQNLQFLESPVCDVMGTPFAYDQGEGALSAVALTDPPPWDKSRAAIVFDQHSKNLIHALKYKDHHEVALMMVRMMARAGRELLSEADCIIPVPLHPTRLWKRRFNQSALLAKPLAQVVSKKYAPDLLVRNVATRQQVGLDIKARQKNVKKAFQVPTSKLSELKDRKVLLVDDVRTTGATFAACAEVLKKAGAGRVNVLSFALVLEPHRFHIDV